MAKKARRKKEQSTGGQGAGPMGGELAWAAGLSLLAWTHRLFFLYSNRDRDWPFTIFYQGDAKTFFLHARALLSGQLYDQGIPFHPPGFPALLAGLHAFLGAGEADAAVPHLQVKVILALLSSLSVGLLFLLVRPYLGRVVATVAALFCTYHFGLYVLAIAPVSEGIYLSLLLLALLTWSRGLDHPLTAPGARPAVGRRALFTGFGLGLLFGLLALLRFESTLVGMLLGAVGLGSAVWAGRRASPLRTSPQQKSAIAVWLLMAVGWWTAVAPWTVRNHLRLDDYNQRMAGQLAEPLPTFVPVTLYGPLNLALANSAEAEGGFSPEAVMGVTGQAALDFTDPRHLEFVLHGDAMARQWIAEHPGDWLRLVVRKWALYLDALELGFGQRNWPGGLVGVRAPVDVFVPDRRGLGTILGLLALVGLGLAWFRPARGGAKEDEGEDADDGARTQGGPVTEGRGLSGPRRWCLLVALLALAGFGTTAFFFGYARQGLLLLPFLAPWMAVALVEAALFVRGVTGLEGRSGWRGSKGRKRFAVLAGSLLLLLFLLEARGVDADRNYRASASSTLDGHHLNPDDAIRLERIED